MSQMRVYLTSFFKKKTDFKLIVLFLFLGWNGKHCTLEGCPNSCNGHGQCKTNHALEWECWCESGWFGQGCDIPLEQDCSDRRDNDQGGSKKNDMKNAAAAADHINFSLKLYKERGGSRSTQSFYGLTISLLHSATGWSNFGT